MVKDGEKPIFNTLIKFDEDYIRLVINRDFCLVKKKSANIYVW